MMRYSFQPKDRIFVEGYKFLSIAKHMGKNTDKNISKNVSSKCSQNFLIMLNNHLQMHLKLLQKEQFKKQQKQLVI